MVNDYKAVQRQTAQYDLFNRLYSIAGDEAFVREIAEHYEGRYEVVANQRCGTWYCDPSSSSSTYAYFKSTDGHMGTWNFNLRRSNLALASRLEEQSGMILVDSTRRGKRMPDALSKTVPIWCTVINRAVGHRNGPGSSTWDSELHLPPIVSPSERSQIEALIPNWVDSLLSSSLTLPALTKPLRPFWIHPASRSHPSISPDAPFTPVICVSASKWVGSEDDVPAVTRVGGGRTVGFNYVQGAGDDDELWSRGLTPAVYYRHRAAILEADKDHLPDLVDRLVASSRADKVSDALSLISISGSEVDTGHHPDSQQPINDIAITGVPVPSSRLAVQLGSPISPSPTPSWAPSQRGSPIGSTAIHTVRVVLADKQRHPPWTFAYTGDTSVFACPSARAEPKAFGMALDELVDHLDGVMDRCPGSAFVLALGADADLAAVRTFTISTEEVECESSKTASRPPLQPVHPTPERLIDYRKALIPIALVLLLSNPDLLDDPSRGLDTENIRKKDIGDMLHQLVALWPDGNPPRAALKRVNEYLMSPYA